MGETWKQKAQRYQDLYNDCLDCLTEKCEELAALRARVAELEAEREALRAEGLGLREALSSWYDAPWTNDGIDEPEAQHTSIRNVIWLLLMDKTADALSTPLATAAAERWKAMERVVKVARALYTAGYWSRSSQGYKDEDDCTYWEAMKQALAALDAKGEE